MVDWIRTLFCKHDWVYKKTVVIWWDKASNCIDRQYDVYCCPKCLKTKRIKYI